MKEQTMAVQRMQDYIEAHLTEKITPAHLAEASLYSPWHSYRLFQDYLGMSPAEYIRRLRLTKSAMRLLWKDSAIFRREFAPWQAPRKA